MIFYIPDLKEIPNINKPTQMYSIYVIKPLIIYLLTLPTRFVLGP